MQKFYIKLEKSDNFVLFSLYFPNRNIERYKRSTSRFYMGNTHFTSLVEKPYCDIDIDALKAYYHDGKVYFTLLRDEYGTKYYFSLYWNDLISWYTSDSKKKFFKNIEDGPQKPNKIQFTESGLSRLKEVLANKSVKNHFRRSIMYFLNYGKGGYTTVFNRDFVPYSFGFSVYKDDVYAYPGGLIYHAPGVETLSVEISTKNRKNPYSVHT